MTYRRFIRQVVVALAAMAALALYPLYAYAPEGVVAAALISAAICSANALAGCYSAVWSLGRSEQSFLTALFGGMLVRMAAIGLIFFLLVKFTDLHVSGLTLSLFFTYILFQILEIRFLVQYLAAQKALKEV
jgi:hypothetical protein